MRNEEKIGTLEETAQKRRERLLALKRKRQGDSEDKDDNDEEKDNEELPSSQVLFR